MKRQPASFDKPRDPLEGKLVKVSWTLNTKHDEILTIIQLKQASPAQHSLILNEAEVAELKQLLAINPGQNKED